MKNKQNINEGLFGAAKKLTDAFFDGLKKGSVNKALKKVEQKKTVPMTIVTKMREIEKASKELQQMLKDLE